MNLRKVLSNPRMLTRPFRRFAEKEQAYDNDRMLAHLQEMRRNCTDQQKLASLDQTIDYLKSQQNKGSASSSGNVSAQQKPAETATKEPASSSRDQEQVSPFTLHDAFNVFDDMRRSFDYMENAMNKAFFGGRGFKPLFSRLRDDMMSDVDRFNRAFDRRFIDRGIEDTFKRTEKEAEDLLEKYKIDDEVPQDAVGVNKHVEKHTVNGKTKAKVRVDYTLKDGRKISKVREFDDDETPKQLKE